MVTQADRDAQAAVIDVIEAAYPDEPVVGEEDDARKTVPEEGPAWIVDPIDGTNNFVNGLRTWGTAVAAVIDGEPVGAAVVLPALGDSYTADREAASLNGEPIHVSDTTDPELATVSPLMWWAFDRRDEYAAATREIVTRFDDLRRLGSAQATLALIAAGSLDGGLTNLQLRRGTASLASISSGRPAGRSPTATATAGDTIPRASSSRTTTSTTRCWRRPAGSTTRRSRPPFASISPATPAVRT
ncbi:MAG: archaeal fructose-1,6-bisphosphatase related enzymes of inositol monophosphatase family [Halonotius sp. J07HN4]|nr:MAG: archaeal fructose-1,6-bisphosphatase related enzymes of inositol monophosphatase family [Halonotius sp. J07HN4]